MAKHAPKLDRMRSRIAHLAARIMAEGGTNDFGQAKLKAARQLDAVDPRALPDNREVETALRAYLALYQPEQQQTVLATLRRRAISLMEQLASFNPHLVGSVLSGTAGRNAEICLQLFCDSPKDVEVFLLNQNVPFDAGHSRVRLGDRSVEVPALSFEFDGSPVSITTFSADDLRALPKYPADGSQIERARIGQLRALIAAEHLAHALQHRAP